MVYLLIGSGVALLIGFYLGILVMALLTTSAALVPAPDPRHVPLLQREWEIRLRQGHGDQAGRQVSRRFHETSTSGTSARPPASHSASHTRPSARR